MLANLSLYAATTVQTQYSKMAHGPAGRCSPCRCPHDWPAYKQTFHNSLYAINGTNVDSACNTSFTVVQLQAYVIV